MSYLSAAGAVVLGTGSEIAQLPGADWSPPPALIVATFLLAGILRWLVWASRPLSSGDDRRSRWWRRGSSRPATLVLPVITLGLVTAAALGGLPGALQVVSVVSVLAWVGATHAPNTSLYLAPVAGAACVLPGLVQGASAAPAASVFVVVPAGIVMAEVISRARSEAERRGRLLAGLAHAGRMVTIAPTSELAATLTGAAVDLGFDVACLLLFDEESKSYVVCGARGLDGVVGSVVRGSEGLFGVEPAACLARRAVVAEKYRDWPFADQELVGAGIGCALAAPLSVGGIPVGVLAGAKRKVSTLTSEEVDAFEVLALQGGLGLETQNRRRAALEAVSL